MDRRLFILTAAATVLATPALAAKTYKKGLVGKELAAGNTVFLDFYADWCTTCRSQEATIRKLKKANPDYEANITFIKVDWDLHSNSQLAKQLNIPRRSTLVVLKGNKELGRIVAGTSKKDIQALMDTALAAATIA